MTFVATPDGALMTIVWGNGEEEWTNTLWWRKQGFTEQDMRDLAEIPGANIQANLLNQLSSNYQLKYTKVYDMRAADGGIVQSTHAVVPGTGTGDALPLTLAVVVTLRTARRGRSGRGRLYLAGWQEPNLTDGRWIPAQVTEIMNFLGAINNQASLLGFAWCVRSGQQDGVPLTSGYLGPITYTEVRSSVPGIQRKRSTRQ